MDEASSVKDEITQFAGDRRSLVLGAVVAVRVAGAAVVMSKPRDLKIGGILARSRDRAGVSRGLFWGDQELSAEVVPFVSTSLHVDDLKGEASQDVRRAARQRVSRRRMYCRGPASTTPGGIARFPPAGFDLTQ
jgi:hypothetical protein